MDHRFAWTALKIVATLPGAHPALAQTPPTEQAVKATYLVKFPAYMNWPPGRAGNRIAICIVGDGPIADLAQAAGRGQRVDGKAVIIRRLPTLDTGAACHIAFLGGSRSQAIRDALDNARRAAIVTVTDARVGGERGIVHFETVNDRVRFHIDEREAARRGITISSKLLNLALSVTERGAP